MYMNSFLKYARDKFTVFLTLLLFYSIDGYVYNWKGSTYFKDYISLASMSVDKVLGAYFKSEKEIEGLKKYNENLWIIMSCRLSHQ